MAPAALARGIGKAGPPMFSNRSPSQRNAMTSLRCREKSLPPTQRITSFQVTETPYPRERGNRPIGRYSWAGLCSANTELCQTLAPPRQGGPSGKLAPPATMRWPPETPANAPANPCLSGNEGNSPQTKPEAETPTAPQPKTKRQSPAVLIVFRIGAVRFLRRGRFMVLLALRVKRIFEKQENGKAKGGFRRTKRRRRLVRRF